MKKRLDGTSEKLKKDLGKDKPYWGGFYPVREDDKTLALHKAFGFPGCYVLRAHKARFDMPPGILPEHNRFAGFPLVHGLKLISIRESRTGCFAGFAGAFN